MHEFTKTHEPKIFGIVYRQTRIKSFFMIEQDLMNMSARISPDVFQPYSSVKISIIHVSESQ